MGTGIQQSETKITLQQLEQDLKLARQGGMAEVVVYRLGGMDEKYARILRRFAGKS